MTASLRRRLSRVLAAAALAAAGSIPAAALATVPAHAAGFDNAAAEARLISEINQDRANNNLGALAVNSTLSSIARSAPHNVCGTGTLHGRSQDMIERGYFDHQIPPCGSYVWPILSSYSVSYTAAGENIAWNNYSPQDTSVDEANLALMNSAPHRANILGAYNQVGVGAYMAPGSWNGSTGVIMYTEIFTMGPPPLPPLPTYTFTKPTATSTQGYNILTSSGAIYSFGDAGYFGNLIDHGYPGPGVGLAETKDAGGYNILTAGGAIYSFGNANYFGNLIDHGYPGPAVALSQTPDSGGYAILTGAGAVYTFGNAGYYGNLIDHGYPGRAVSIAYTRTGNGYNILTDSGAIYSFGDAQYLGNLIDHGYPGTAISLHQTRSGGGYGILTTSGAIYNFGDAPYYGNLIDHGYPGPAVAISNTP